MSGLGLLALWGAVLLPPAPAHGFECTRTQRNDFVSIRWLESPIPYAIRAPGPRLTDTESALAALRQGFAAWEGPTCAHIGFDDRGVVAAETPLEEVNQVIFLPDDWPHDSDAVALTTMTFSTIDGTISFGKIEINEFQFQFADTVPPGAQACGTGMQSYDLQAVLTHEIGHFIGLAHATAIGVDPVGVPDAPTMSPRVLPCDPSFRTLAPDDLEGLCFIYPRGQRARGCDSLPRQNTPYVQNQAFGCTAHRDDTRTGLLLVLVAVGGFIAGRSRRS